MSDIHQERRLRPIYEALDSQNNKQALSLCNKALKKPADALVVKALKAIALDRLGREDEALEICAEVAATQTTDQAVLQYIVMVYKSNRKTREVIEVYANAYTQDPRNEEIANHWFMALVRAGDWKQVQQASMKIQKQFQNNRYLFWTIVTVWLQAKQGGPQRTLLTTLAERMVVKAAQDGRLQDYEALQLYIEILDSQGKYTEALEVINGDLGKLCKVDADRKHIIAGLAKRAEAWKAVLTVSKELLLASPDDWSSCVSYVQAITQIVAGISDREAKESTIEQARNFISVLQTKGSAGKHTKRGPFLAELELESALLAAKQIDATLAATRLAELIASYTDRFGSALSCFDDLKAYMGYLPAGTLGQLLMAAEEAARSSVSVDATRRIVNIEKMRRYTENELTETQAKERVSHYLEAYKTSIPLGSSLDERELQPGDDFILLAAHTLLDVFAKNRTQRTILGEVAALLEFGRSKSKYSFQMTLLLVRVYIELGVYTRPLEIIKTLDIKQIQNDTLSYLFMDDLELLGCPEPAMRALVKALTIYGSNDRETPEMIVQAFKFGTYSKIPEFAKFRSRLTNSLQLAVTQRQLYRVEILRRFPALDNLGHYLEIIDDNILQHSDDYIEHLSDNRDVTLLASWARNDKVNQVATQVSGSAFPRKRDEWLKIHALVPLILRGICTDGAPLWRKEHDALAAVLKDTTNTTEEDAERVAARSLIVLSRALLSIRDPIDGEQLDLKPVGDLISELTASAAAPRQTSMSFNVLKSLTLLLEATNYLCIGLACITAPSAKASRKSQEVAARLESLNSLSNDLLTGLRDRVKAHKEIATPAAAAGLVTSSSLTGAMEADEISKFAGLVESELSTSWNASLHAMNAAISNRLDRPARA
ncbi:N-alpha-acetyltransferase 25, NatB auxiliary subunit [Thoreauomyces humboldtii]|nr:N-alpha-acetyltransferase 25, NatB auxiliary subunit [Thoreauomyces humboldtii]